MENKENMSAAEAIIEAPTFLPTTEPGHQRAQLLVVLRLTA
jgi:hypothetical protein